MTPVIAVIVVLAYLLGSIPFGLIVSKSRGIDIREHGSKNIGATNVWRVLGKTWGLTTFAADVLKGVAAILLAKWIADHWQYPVPLPRGRVGHANLPHDFAGIAAALGCILGHSFPVWLRFKGGKGVATSLGVIVGMMPLVALTDFALWSVVFAVSRYVSLASIVAAAALPVLTVAFIFAGWVKGWGYFYFAVAAGLLVIRRHRDNIKRLMAGTESRFERKKSDGQ
ncbi:MAG: glycerol-3-phosphate 1-O-acyltransferase PlsY [Chthoniobacteraceae bacterium]